MVSFAYFSSIMTYLTGSCPKHKESSSHTSLMRLKRNEAFAFSFYAYATQGCHAPDRKENPKHIRVTRLPLDYEMQQDNGEEKHE